MTFLAYPSIEQFRTVIKKVQTRTRYVGKDGDGESVYDHTIPLPVLKYKGTVKLHGTNACIHFPPDSAMVVFQSRNNEITAEKDNAGFAAAMTEKNLAYMWELFSPHDDVYIYGEWCGGNIQKNVALTQIPKMFVMFDVVVNGETRNDFLSSLHRVVDGVYSIQNFPSYNVEIDFNSPEAIQNTLVEYTIKVEENCPVAASFGVDGIGEGVVWSLAESTDKFKVGDSELTFKVKGEKHSSSNVTTLAAVDIERVNNMKEFVAKVVTDNRCNQGLDFLKEKGLELSVKSTGDFVKWVFNDIIKEESDTITESGLEFKEVGGPIAKASKSWFFGAI